MESVHSSLCRNCHHRLIYAKINLKLFYLSHYECEIWHYERANIDQIQQAIEQFSSEKSFRNLTKWYFYLILKLLKIFFQTTFTMKQSLVMAEIHLGLTRTSSS